jgi:hypothetical protein
MNAGPLSMRHEHWSMSTLFNDLIQHGHGARGRDAPGGIGGESLAGELVSHVQDLDGSPIGGFVELKIKRPDVVGMISSNHDGVSTGLGLSLLRTLHQEAFSTPETLDSLAIHDKAISKQQYVDAPVAGAGVVDRQGSDARS